MTALRALAWLVAEPGRADRLLALTGLDADELRERAGDPTLLGAVLAFLEAHEPDLVACAEAIDVPAERIVAARAVLDR